MSNLQNYIHKITKRRLKHPYLFLIALIMTLWGCIAFIFNFCMIFVHNYVFHFSYKLNAVVTILEWSADLLYIICGGISTIGIYFENRRIFIIFFILYTIYLPYGWAVIIAHITLIPNRDWDWKIFPFATLGSTIFCLLVFLPYWLIFVSYWCGIIGKVKKRLPDPQQKQPFLSKKHRSQSQSNLISEDSTSIFNNSNGELSKRSSSFSSQPPI